MVHFVASFRADIFPHLISALTNTLLLARLQIYIYSNNFMYIPFPRFSVIDDFSLGNLYYEVARKLDS